MLRCGFEQFFWIQPEPPDRGVNPGPMFLEKLLELAFMQQISRAGSDEHPEAAPLFDKFFVDQFLISFQDGDGIDPGLRRDVADRRQGVAFIEHAIENHMHATIAKLAIDWLSVIPFTIHS